MSQDTAFSTRSDVRPAKIQISLRIRIVWLESSQCTLWVAKDPKRVQVDSEDNANAVPRLY